MKNTLLKKESGSITIEASLIIPILLMFILVLISFVKISIAEMALEDAVTDTAREASHYSYLALEMMGAIDKKRDGFMDSLTEGAAKKSNHDLIGFFLSKLNTKAKTMIPKTGQVVDMYSDALFRGYVRDKYEKTVGSSSFFNPESLDVDTTTPWSPSNADIKIQATVTLKLVVPFFEKDIKIRKLAYERAWAGQAK